MITRRTRIQLMVFALITMVGVSFAGAKYAGLDRFFRDTHYEVVARFAAAGGIYPSAEVSWRGVGVGRVTELVLTREGVDVHLEIENEFDQIPADLIAVVANRSAVGEQYVDLQPRTDLRPYLADGATITTANTRTPVPTEKLLGDTASTVGSVNAESLTTTIDELGAAFAGAGDDLERLLDSSTAFLRTADANFAVTEALIRDSNTVLAGQVDSTSALTSFAANLSLFSGVLAERDPDLRELITNGAAGAIQLREFLDEVKVDLSELLAEAVTIGGIVQKRLPGLKQVLSVYPYVVEGGFTVVEKDSKSGLWNAHFGLVLTPAPLCEAGYNTAKRPPQDGSNRELNTNARCSEPATKSNPRGAQNLGRTAPGLGENVAGSYDSGTGQFSWGDPR